MICYLANKCLAFLTRRINLDSTKGEVYLYGLELFLHTLLSTIGLLVISILFRKFFEGSIIIAIYYSNQTIGGGFHASTHWRCFLTMAIGLTCCLCTFWLPYSLPVYLVLAAIALALMMGCPLVLHKNKVYLAARQKELRKRSRIALLVQAACLAVVILCGDDAFIQAFCVALVGCGVSRLTATLQKACK